MDLKNLTPELDLTEKEVHVPDVNRPALQLSLIHIFRRNNMSFVIDTCKHF